MVSFFRIHFLQYPRRVAAIILALAFCMGLLLGAYIATLTDPSYFLMMRTAVSSRVSITGLLPALLLPFLFSAFAVYLSQIWLLIPIAFTKAFFFSFLSTGFLILSPGSGWLMRMLFMFTDCLSLPVLCWFWLRACGGEGVSLRGVLSVFLVISGIGCLDFQFISPFLVSLLS